MLFLYLFNLVNKENKESFNLICFVLSFILSVLPVNISAHFMCLLIKKGAK